PAPAGRSPWSKTLLSRRRLSSADGRPRGGVELGPAPGGAFVGGRSDPVGSNAEPASTFGRSGSVELVSTFEGVANVPAVSRGLVGGAFDPTLAFLAPSDASGSRFFTAIWPPLDGLEGPFVERVRQCGLRASDTR